MKRFVSATILVASVTIAGCSSDIPSPSGPQSLARIRGAAAAMSADEASAALLEIGNAVNAALAAEGAEFALEQAEWIGEDAEGNTVLFSDRGDKRLPQDFVPGDPRRIGGSRTNIIYIIDQVDGNTNDGLTTAQTSDAIQRAMSTWNSVSCSTPIPIQRRTNVLLDVGVVEFQRGWGGGSPFFFADIQHAGWMAPGRLPPNVIAVTFTFVFVSGGAPTDIDNNGRADVAFREIYYNDRFVWRINANIDVETIALHEAGHGLSQGHFGMGMIKNDGTLQLSPAAVMNAAYTGVRQELLGTDNAGHCANWASWPSN